MNINNRLDNLDNSKNPTTSIPDKKSSKLSLFIKKICQAVASFFQSIEKKFNQLNPRYHEQMQANQKFEKLEEDTSQILDAIKNIQNSGDGESAQTILAVHIKEVNDVKLKISKEKEEKVNSLIKKLEEEKRSIDEKIKEEADWESDWDEIEFHDCIDSGDEKVFSPYTGLQNLGSTCYMNSFLQMLLTEERLSKAFEKPWDHIKDSEERNQWELIRKAFLEVQKESKEDHVKKETLETFFLVLQISGLFPILEEANSSIQMDMDEFLTQILRVILPGFQMAYQTILEQASEENTSYIESKNPETENDSKLIFHLPNQKKIDFDELILRRLDGEEIEELRVESYKVKDHKKKKEKVVRLTKPFSFFNLQRVELIANDPPEILPVHFGRFGIGKNGELVKNQSKIHISTQKSYDFSLLFSCSNQEEILYRMTSFAVHTGPYIQGGHYFTCKWSEEEKSWFELNDNQVRKLTHYEAKKYAKQAVWAFFTKQTN